MTTTSQPDTTSTTPTIPTQRPKPTAPICGETVTTATGNWTCHMPGIHAAGRHLFRKDTPHG